MRARSTSKCISNSIGGSASGSRRRTPAADKEGAVVRIAACLQRTEEQSLFVLDEIAGNQSERMVQIFGFGMAWAVRASDIPATERGCQRVDLRAMAVVERAHWEC